MATLLQCIQSMIDNISVTDKQEDNIKASLSNLDNHLLNKDNKLFVERTFTNGSYERDTIIRPLNDIDLFAVLKFEDWKDESGTYPSPQAVLTKIKNYLNDQNDYKDKVKQDRPCVTVELSDKDFDILPVFAQADGGYRMPSYDLKSWTWTYPEQLSKDLDDTNKNRKGKLKDVVKSIKYWNRENGKLIPSFHIEEAVINIFKLNDFTNFEQAIRLWFNNAEYNLISSKFKSNDDYLSAISKIKKVKEKLNKAKEHYDKSEEGEAIKIWKEVFGLEFPTVNVEEAKSYSKALSEGAMKISQAGTISTVAGKSVSASRGFFGGEDEK